MIFTIYLIGFVIENDGRRPAPSRKQLLLNSAHVFVYQAAGLTLGVITIYYLRLLFEKAHYHSPIHLHGGGFSVLAFSLLVVVAQDFFYYWFHRLQHSNKWLWAQHELHHSDENVNVTTSWRHHWLETVLEPPFILTPTMLLFTPAVAPILWIAGFTKLMTYFLHLNFPLRFGWFSRVLTGPQIHRIHHSSSPEHIDKNFATILPLWDILFGTYHHPKKGEWPSTGVEGVIVTSLWQAIALPFLSWGKMLSPDAPTLEEGRLEDGECHISQPAAGEKAYSG